MDLMLTHSYIFTSLTSFPELPWSLLALAATAASVAAATVFPRWSVLFSFLRCFFFFFFFLVLSMTSLRRSRSSQQPDDTERMFLLLMIEDSSAD